MNLGTWLTKPLVGVLVAAALLTVTWAVLQHQVATPRGLTRSISVPNTSSGLSIREDTTPTVDLDFLELDSDLPPTFSVRWQGYWFATEEQRITLRARTGSRVNIYLDGERVLRHQGAVSRGPASTSVTLTAGAHQLVVDYDHQDRGDDLRVEWTPGAARAQPLPPSRLFNRRLNRRDFYETMAVGWLAWVAVGAWLSVLLLAFVPTSGRQLVRTTAKMWRALLTAFEHSTGIRVTRALHIFALVALVVAQPLFEVASREPAFFVARNTTMPDLIALVGVVCIALPALLIGIEIALGRISAIAARVMRRIVLTVLGTALVMPILNRTDSLGATLSVGFALLVAGAGTVAYQRFAGVRTFITALSPAIVVIPSAFLLNADVRGAVVSTDAIFSPVRVTNRPPIVIVVFDEFPVSSLLGLNRELDRTHYPNFARLADTATWYRNASTVSSQTAWAVPAIVSGKYPIEPNAIPTRRYFPNNLFTMLGDTYDMTVFGRFIQLCPANRCTYDLEVHDSVGSLVTDLGIVYAHIVSPNGLAARLPPILGDWRDFRRARQFRNQDGERRRNTRISEFDRFLDAITSDGEGRLYFLHTLTPHMPFEYVPSGHRYNAPDYQAHQEGGRGLFFETDPWLPTVLQQRHLLQVGFADGFIGLLVDRLKAQQIFNEALIIITADHGTSFQHGLPRRRFAEGTRAEVSLVPLIVKYPGQVAGFISGQNVETIDIVPTIASVLSTTVPYDIDGRSLLDFTQPQRLHKTFIQRTLTRVRTEVYEPLLDDRHTALEQKLRHFETGWYALGPHASLVGRPLSALEVRTGAESPLRLDAPLQFDDVDLERHTLPLFVQGRMSAGIEDRVSVVIAVNGVVAATTQSYMEGDEWVFASLIPEEALTPGANDVRVFVVDGATDQPVLTLATLEPR